MLLGLLQSHGLQLKRKTGDEYAGPCPFCGGTDRFVVWAEKKKFWCRQCGERGDSIDLLQKLKGLSFQEAKQAAGGDNGDRPQRQPRKTPPPKSRPGREPFVHPELGKPDHLWRYTDEQGSPLFFVARFNQDNGEKTIRQCRPDGLSWSVKGVRAVLYNLPEVINSPEIWIAEGEGCADAVTSLGFVGTTSPMGAGKWPKLEEDHQIGKPLHKKKVFILPDNDEPGRKHAGDIAQSLHGKAQVFILELPGLPEKGDIADYLKQHGPDKTAEDLARLAEQAKPWRPARPFFSARDLLNTSFERQKPIIGRGILPHGGHMLIAGETGVGKSLLRSELALHLVAGWSWLGFDVSSAKRVAVFQYENPESTEQTRLRRMCQGLGLNLHALPENALIFADRRKRVNLSLKGDRARLLEMVKECEAEVIFYDCLSNLWAGDENKNMQLREIVDVLSDVNAEAGTACILIHHFNKGGPDVRRSIERIRGASSLVDWAMTAIAFTVRPHENKVLRQVEFVKVRDGATPKPLLVERDENFLLALSDEDSLCPPERVKELLQALGGQVDKGRPLLEAIQGEAGCSDRTARKLLARAVEMREVAAIEQGNGKPKRYIATKERDHE